MAVHDNAALQCGLVSLVAHAAVAAWIAQARFVDATVSDTPEIELVDVAIEAPIPVPPALDPSLSGSPAAIARNILVPTRAAALSAIPDETSPRSVRSEENDTGDAIASNAREISDVPCEGDECVLEALNRCLAGDGDGCVGVGLYYERGRADPFSAIKWYVKGCGLASQAACAANDRVKDAKPLAWRPTSHT